VQTLNQLVESGQWQGLFAQVPLLDVVQWNVLRQLSHLVWQASQKTSGRSNAGLQTLHRQLAELLAGDYHSEQMSQLHTAWCERVQPWLAAQQPQLLSNYLCYYVFHHHFPCGELRQPLRQFRMLLADYFLLRSLPKPAGVHRGRVDHRGGHQPLHHYHTRRQHNHLFREALHESLLASDMDQDLALYALLKLKPA
jgi:lysine-N-methylase